MQKQATGQGVDAKALWDEPVGVDAKALWDEPEPEGNFLQETGDFLAGVGGELLGSAGAATGMMMEGLGRFGEFLTSPPLDEFDERRGALQVDRPGEMRQSGLELKTNSQGFASAARAELQQEHPIVSAVAGGVGSTVPIIGAGVVGGPAFAVGTAGAAGASMGYTAYYDEAIAHGAPPEDAALAGSIGAASGTLQGLPLVGTMGRIFGKMPGPLRKLIESRIGKKAARYVAEPAAEALQEGGDQALQNVTASDIVGYDEDRQIIEGVVKAGGTGAASQLILSAIGIGGGKRPVTKFDGSQPAPIDQPEPEPAAPEPTDVSRETIEPPPLASAEVQAAVEATQESPQPQRATKSAEVQGTATASTEAGQAAATLPVAEPTQAATPVVESQEAVDEPQDSGTGGAQAPPESGSKRSEAPPSDEKRPPTEKSADSDLSDLVGIHNKEIDAQFSAMGVDPPTHGERTTWKGELESAKAILDSDQKAGERLVNELAENPREPSKEDNALLIMEAVRLKNETDAARAALDKATASGEGVETAHARVQDVARQYLKMGQVATTTGTGTAQALAIRAVMAKRDYSLAEITRSWQDAKGEELTEAEHKEIRELHDQIKDLTEKHAKVIAENRELRAAADAKALIPAIKERARRARSERPRGAIREKIHKDAEESRAFFREFSKRAHSGLPVDAIPHLIRIGADVIASGATEFSVWSEAIIREVGERARPHLEEAYTAAKKLVRDARMTYLTGKIGERLTAGNDISRYVQKMAEQFAADGITELDPLVDAIHAELKKIDPTMTRTQARDIFTGFGKYKPATEDEIKRKIADLKGEGQKVAQIEYLEKGLAPPKTGFGRVEPGPKQRELRKRINDLRKKAGIKVEHPDKALKTALQTKETSLRNRIEALQHEIDTGTRTVTTDTPSPTSPTTEQLEEQLAKLKAEHEAIFGKPGASDEQKAQAAIKSVERAIAENKRRLREQDLSPKPQKQGPPTEVVAALQAQRAALKARNEALKAELDHLRDAQEIADPGPSAEEKRLQREIENFGKPRVGPMQGPGTEAVEALRAKLRALRVDRAEAVKAARAKARKTPEQIALQAKKTRDLNITAENLERLATGNFAKPDKRPPLVLDEEAIKIETRKKNVQALVHKRRKEFEYENRTRRQKIQDALKEILDLPRAIWSSFDFSGVFFQGGFLAFGSDPRDTIRQISSMMRAAANKDYAERVDTKIRTDPRYELARLAKLDITSLDGVIGPREENRRSKLSHKIPGIPASDRAFVTFLNQQRFDAFNAIVRAIPGTPTLEDARAIARFVNIATGRGQSRRLDAALPVVGRILWAPKLMLSRLQLLVPIGSLGTKTTPVARKIVAKQYAKTLVGLAVMYGLLSFFDDDEVEIEKDPRSSSFGKIKVGNTTVDPLFGMSQYVTLIARLGPKGETKSRSGETDKVEGDSWMRFAGNFIRGKATPLLGQAINVRIGKNVVGDKVTPTSALKEAAIPLSFQDIYDAMRAEGLAEGAALGILGAFGLRINTITEEK